VIAEDGGAGIGKRGRGNRREGGEKCKCNDCCQRPRCHESSE
jgi:hypothetical protein